MPEISVVIPVYNVEKYVEKCLRSVLGQTFRDFEVLAVIDGATDRSREICERIAQEDARVRVVVQENQGQGGARNTGIEQAKGEWIAFSDSDDWLEPETLARSLEAGKRYGADMVVFAYQTVNPQGQVLQVYQEPSPKDKLLSPSEQKDVLFTSPGPCNKLYRAELFRSTGVRFPTRVWYEDLRTIPKLIAASRKIVFLDYIGYNYFMREGSTMFNTNLERNGEILAAADDLLEYFHEKGLYEPYKDELCYLTLYHAYLTASVRVIRIDRKSPLLERFRQYLKEAFPRYRENRYLGRLSHSQRLLLALLEKQQYWLIALLFKIKG